MRCHNLGSEYQIYEGYGSFEDGIRRLEYLALGAKGFDYLPSGEKPGEKLLSPSKGGRILRSCMRMSRCQGTYVTSNTSFACESAGSRTPHCCG